MKKPKWFKKPDLRWFALTLSMWMWSRSSMNEFQREQHRKKGVYIPSVRSDGKKLTWKEARTEAGAILYLVSISEFFENHKDLVDNDVDKDLVDNDVDKDLVDNEIWDTGLSWEERAKIWEKNSKEKNSPKSKS